MRHMKLTACLPFLFALVACGGNGPSDRSNASRQASEVATEGKDASPGLPPTEGGTSPTPYPGGGSVRCAETGEACTPGSGCGGGDGACSHSCTCDESGHFRCEETCGGGAGGSDGGGEAGGSTGGPVHCAETGEACTPGSGCGGGDGTCSHSCTCDESGHFRCEETCGGAGGC
jgi:hypothetical protein